MVLENLRDWMGRIEAMATDVVARLAPWTAPLPTAYLVGRATVEHLRWPTAVGIVVAIIVESLGLATTATALELREYNKSKRKSDPFAPFALSAVLVGVYFAVAVGLTVALDIVPTLATYAPAIFPILSLCGVTVLALRGDHRRRVVTLAQGKAERKAARQRRKSAARRAELEPAQVAHYTETGDNTRKRARAILAERPGISGSELGRKLGRSERLGRKLKAELLPELELTVSSNGREAS